jgi:hypothetical protein
MGREISSWRKAGDAMQFMPRILPLLLLRGLWGSDIVERPLFQAEKSGGR